MYRGVITLVEARLVFLKFIYLFICLFIKGTSLLEISIVKWILTLSSITKEKS